MDSGVAGLVGAAIGSLAGWVAPVISWRLGKADRDADEQKGIARDVLLRVERFCRDYRLKRHLLDKSLCAPELLAAADEMAVKFLELRDERARKHMDCLDTCIWFMLQPQLHKYSESGRARGNERVLQLAPREILGPIVRGEAIPKNLPECVAALLKDANDANDYVEHMIASQEQGEAALAEEAAAAAAAKGRTGPE